MSQQSQNGYIYVASNPSLTLLKIGITKDFPDRRMRELSTTGVPDAFILEYCALVPDYQNLEKVVHRDLGDKRHTQNREFFDVTVTQAIIAIRSKATKLLDEQIFFQTEEEVEAERIDGLLKAAASKVPEQLDAVGKSIRAKTVKSFGELANTIENLPYLRRITNTYRILSAIALISLFLIVASAPLPKSYEIYFYLYFFLFALVLLGLRIHQVRQANCEQKLLEKRFSKFYLELLQLLEVKRKELLANPDWEQEIDILRHDLNAKIDEFVKVEKSYFD